MKGIIDRIEGRFAIVELDNKVMLNIDTSQLPPEIREGDIITEKNGEYYIDTDETEKRKKNIKKLMNDLFT